MSDSITLRPYQKATVNCVNAALKESRKVCLVSPTGSGKAVEIAWYAQAIASLGRRLLIVTNRRILVQQLASQCKKYGVPFGIIMGNEPRNDEALVQVASLQTLKIRKWANMPEASWLIVDESHQAPGACGTLFDIYPDSKCLGVTATPVGPAGTTLLGLYDRIVEPVRKSDLIHDGWLLNTRVIAPSEPDMECVWIDKNGKSHKGVTIQSNGEYSQEQVAKVVEQCTCFANIWEWYEQFAHMQTLVFTPRVKYAYGVCEQFRERGIKAEVIDGTTKNSDRKQMISSFADTDARVLVSCDVLREGFDCPTAQCGIDLQPNMQVRTWLQKLGRVCRPYEGQKNAVWLDFAGNLWRHGIHPDEDPPWSELTESKTIAELLAERSGRRCKSCGSDQIKSGRCLDCGAECDPGKKPWVCQHCHYSLSPWERLTDGKCPNCGQKTGKQVRHIRMGDGKMRVVSADEVKLRKRSTASEEQKVWDACRYKAMHCRKPLSFASVLYHKEMKMWPDHRKLKSCPQKGSSDWARSPAEVFEHMDPHFKYHQKREYDSGEPTF